MFKLFNRKHIKTAGFDNYDDYIKIQYRTAPREFMDPRLRIVSSFVYIMPKLAELGISRPVIETEGKAQGQLKQNEIKILDAGCRDGWTIEFLNSLGYSEVLGVDLFDDYIDYCNKHGREAVKGDLHDLQFSDGEFDFVYCRHTLEHCLDPIKVLRELLRVTNDSGAVYCSFPLEQETFGKHTTAFVSEKAVKAMLREAGIKSDQYIFVGKAARTGVVIPESDEMIIFIRKN